MNYTSRRNVNKGVSKTFKDYMIPIVIVFVISIVVLNYVFSSPDSASNPQAKTSPVEITLTGAESESYVIATDGSKNKIDTKTTIWKWEKIQVANGVAQLKLAEGVGQMMLKRLGELKYNDDGGYTLFSSDLWVNAEKPLNIEMRYAKVTSTSTAVFSLSQNDVASNIYVVSGSVDISNTAGNTTTLQKGEKLVIMRTNANDKEFNLGLAKEQIDDYIKNDEWFTLNNGASYLAQMSLDASGSTLSGSTLSWVTLSGTSLDLSQTSLAGDTTVTGLTYITFDNLSDEMQVSSDVMNVEGKILVDNVYKIELNGLDATIDTQTKTFKVKNFKIPAKTNDLVYRVYDDSGKVLYKGVLTVYNPSGTDETSASSTQTSGAAKVENYPLANSPVYKILSPKQNPLTTSDDLVRLEGTVPAKTIEKIVVNGFKLTKFPAYGSYWSYFANTQYGNLKEWVNLYKIEYYGEGGKVVYENTITIIKKPSETASISTASTSTASGNTSQATLTGEIISGQ